MWGKIAHPTLAREDTYMWYISDCVIVAYQHVWHRGSLSRTRARGGANHGPRTFGCTTHVWARPAYTNVASIGP